MSDWGLKIALPGYDVGMATAAQCALHSSYASPKIKKNQSPAHRQLVNINFGSKPAAGDTTLYSVAHGYGYIPMVWAVAQETDSSASIFGFAPFNSGIFSVRVQADATNMSIICNNPGGAFDPTGIILNISYAIFAEQGG